MGARDGTTVHMPRFDPSPAPEGTYRVTVVEGPDQGRAFEIGTAEVGRVFIGKSEGCAVRLSDQTVSRRHAALEMSGPRLRITDLGSRNGTRVNGVAVLDGHLQGGETVRVGETVLRFEHRPAQAAPLSAATRFGRVIGASTEMKRIYPLCERLAAAAIPVVIEGETGTGKEVLAESLHEQGPRAAGPFVVFDCTAVPPNLVEAELFGHEKGAFTGAVSAREGVFERAQGGTLLIDEIGDLDIALQAKLLRAIERTEVRRLGGSATLRVDVRVIAATRRDLDREVHAQRFRDDLFHRLAVARVELPPLRRRQGDVLVLARHFWQQAGGKPADLGAELLSRWQDYDWPGNVRELRNAVVRHLALGELADVEAGGWRPAREDEAFLDEVLALPLAEARQKLLERFERKYVARMLERHGGNVTRAAAASGVARRHFQTLKARSTDKR